ncbi:hypothetical protein [Amnibacterium setariae]|uniref:Uncharacterized protein n=1 Tax=Amnibacterium setariae TaxID=2306585 RepID=A0A3A1U338_9MICO|nr:hypothetical protein [Amnibacterium setariae]RIX28267.1 hypothetical protein D1781_12485 [Amnibacterium setariae]
MWQDVLAWFQSPGGARVLQTAIIPALAILVAGLLAAAIARSAVRALIRRSERTEASAAIGALVAAGRAAAGPDAERSTDRRAARLRAEADVRVRLLPLAGSDVAADWASARLDALQQRPADASTAAALDELRDRLVEWAGRPARAKRVFAVSPVPARDAEQAAAPTPRTEQAAPAPAPAERPAPLPETARAEPGPREEPATRERFTRPAEPTATGAEPAPAASAPAAAPAQPDHEPAVAVASTTVPAWRRTRAGERLQQEHDRARTPEPAAPAPAAAQAPAAAPAPAAEEEPEQLGTAPVQVPQAHRAHGTPSSDANDAVRLEAHQQARHARPTDEAPAATGVVPTPVADPAPAWLDTYDDEAQVTQNLDLKTPPPVAASAVRDRGGPGEDLVPRS